MQIIQSRRHFLAGLSAAGAAGLVNSPLRKWIWRGFGGHDDNDQQANVWIYQPQQPGAAGGQFLWGSGADQLAQH